MIASKSNRTLARAAAHFIGGMLLSSVYCLFLYITGRLDIIFLITTIGFGFIAYRILRPHDFMSIEGVFEFYYFRLFFSLTGFHIILSLTATIAPMVFYSVLTTERSAPGIIWFAYNHLPQADLSKMYHEHKLDILWDVYKMFNIAVVFFDALVLLSSALVMYIINKRSDRKHADLQISYKSSCSALRAPHLLSGVCLAFLFYVFGAFFRGQAEWDPTVIGYSFIHVVLNFIIRSAASILLYGVAAVSVLGYACRQGVIQERGDGDGDE